MRTAAHVIDQDSNSPHGRFVLTLGIIVGLALAAGTPARAVEPGARPNILLIMPDDQ